VEQPRFPHTQTTREKQPNPKKQPFPKPQVQCGILQPHTHTQRKLKEFAGDISSGTSGLID